MSSGNHHYHHNRYNSNSHRRDSPSSRSSNTTSTSRPRYNSKTSSSTENSLTRTKPAATSICNGKTMPSISTTSADSQISDGMANLALENCRYHVGSKVTIKLLNGSVNRGEVVAYDKAFKIAMLKSSGSRHGVNNVAIINLAHCAEIKVDDEAKAPPSELSSLKTQKLDQRMNDSIEQKKKLIMAFKVGISPDGQKLFLAIRKTINDVHWNGDKVVVMKDVTIEPPYKSDTIRGNQDSKAVTHVRKIVEKYIADQETARASGSAASATLSPTATISSASSTLSSASSSTTAADSPAATTSSVTSPSTTATNSPSVNNNNSYSNSYRGRPSRNSGPTGGRNNPPQNRHGNSSSSNNNNADHHPKPIFPWAKYRPTKSANV